MRRATDEEVRRFGVQWRADSAWRDQPSIAAQAASVRKKIGRKRRHYVAQYASMLGIDLKEAKARIRDQRTRCPGCDKPYTRDRVACPVDGGWACMECATISHGQSVA